MWLLRLELTLNHTEPSLQHLVIFILRQGLGKKPRLTLNLQVLLPLEVYMVYTTKPSSFFVDLIDCF